VPAVAVNASWTFDFGPIVLLLAAGIIYGRRFRAARAAANAHRNHQAVLYARAHEAPTWRALCFGGALLAVFAALISPIDRLGESVLTMHMLQHLLLLDIAPILLILGLNKVLLRPVTRRFSAVERRAGLIAHPAFAVLAYAGIMWAWHIPAMYDAALKNTTVHAFEHVCFVTVGTLYWWHLLSPIRSRMRMGGLGPVAYMTATKLLVGLLGIVLAFAPSSFYPFYAHHPHYWGLSPSEDQSMAGLEMALEQSIVMGIALVVVFVQMLNESEREAQRSERYEVA
jgi:putative membrane protein